MISKQNLLRAAAVCIALAASACAKGANTFDDTINGSSGAAATTCGNGTIEPTEECDPKAMLPANCAMMGASGGMMACNPVTCMLDTSMCLAATAGGGGTGH